ncbi:acyl-CoA dehydrogenase [Paenibacillus pectinilyticus]|uniref:Acyl-CoA dehydrogenase n=1 Tax=Paenibacillus pectinilyticus TaxID=512399 RepID=A0A1C1A011_9BACL|nr:acyl-CoA dehydrogenase family protein [Paenibacillus pectinilyticus]OCT13699.1 acyl-CoA dehydrogenase [Paenibacillus pectinilyticus]
MDYSLSEELEMIRRMVREFAIDEVAPGAALRDETERFDRPLFEVMGKLGLTGIAWAESYGGLGSDVVTNIMVLEELARACASTGYSLFVHSSLAGAAISMFGREEQKIKYLRPMAEGSKLGAYAWTELAHLTGTSGGELHTKTRRDGDHYVLQGDKFLVPNAGEADVYVVFAAMGDGPLASVSTAFLIEKDTPGFMLGKSEQKLGTRGSPSMSVELDGCRIPADNRLGEEGDGHRIALRTLEGARSGIAALAVGLAQAAMDAAIAYAKARKQFGKPIAQQQAIAFKLANMATQIEAARWLTYQAAWRESEGVENGGSGETANTNLFAGEMAMGVTLEAVQIHGGYGYTKAFPVERYLRDAKMLQMVEATMDEQRRAIARVVNGAF